MANDNEVPFTTIVDLVASNDSYIVNSLCTELIRAGICFPGFVFLNKLLDFFACKKVRKKELRRRIVKKFPSIMPVADAARECDEEDMQALGWNTKVLLAAHKDTLVAPVTPYIQPSCRVLT